MKLEPRDAIQLGWLVDKPRHPLAKHYDPFDRTEEGGFSSDIPLSYPEGTESAPSVEENVDLYYTIHKLKDGSVELHPLPSLLAHSTVHETIRIKAGSRITYQLQDPRAIWKRIEQAAHCQQPRPGVESAQEWLRDRDKHAYLVTGLVTLKDATIKEYHLNLGKRSFNGHVSVADIVAVATEAEVADSTLDAVAAAVIGLGSPKPASTSRLADVKRQLKSVCTVVEGKSSKCIEESIFLIQYQHVDLKQRLDWINGRPDGKVRETMFVGRKRC